MFCTKCGARCDVGRFCGSCGAPLEAPGQQQAAPGATPNSGETTMNEQFPCGILQPPNAKVFGVNANGVTYGNELYPFNIITGIFKQNDSTAVTLGVYYMKVAGNQFFLVYKHSDRERAVKALKYAQQKIAEAHGETIKEDTSNEGVVYDLKGVRGRHMKIYEDRVVLTVKATLGSFITGNISDGEKTIYFEDCIGVQFKESGLQIGYLQFETAGRLMNNASSNFFNENTFTWDTTVQTNEFMKKVADYARERVRACKHSAAAPAAPAVSGADELKKFKELLDLGIITQEEFDKKKQQILGF